MKKIIFPEFTEYPKESLPIQNSIRLRKSIRGILTIFNTYKITIDTNTFVNPQTIDFGEALQNIENHIKTLILHYSKNQEDETLKEIFHYIHFWGGVTGRNIYTINGGFENNFNIDTYKKIVEKTIYLKQETLYEDLKQIEKWFMSIPQLGVAFGTKHLRFWSINANENKIELPILDSILTIRLLYKCNPTWNNYYPYVIQMQEEAKNRKVSVTKLERALYNKFN
jgi:hypothetical protein